MKLRKFDRGDLALLNGNKNAQLKFLRSQRVKLLKAFDVYKSNALYGIELETEQEKKQIVEWYNKILELDEASIYEIPQKIKRYL